MLSLRILSAQASWRQLFPRPPVSVHISRTKLASSRRNRPLRREFAQDDENTRDHRRYRSNTLLPRRTRAVFLKEEMTQVEELGPKSQEQGYHRGGFAFHPYSKHLQELLSVDHPNLKIVTEGVSGEKASDMNTRLAVLLRERQYDWVIILGGTNDLAYDAKPKALAETIFLLHSMCHKVGARTVAITIPECAIERKESGESLGEAKNAVNNLIRDFALKSDGKVLLADLWAEIPCVSLSKEEQEKYWDDHLHFSPAGYDKMADIIYKVFKNSTV